MQPQPIRETFWDIEAASEHLSTFWDVQLLQKSPGVLRLDFGAVSIGRCLIYECSTNVDLVAAGVRAEQFVTISPITSDCVASRFRGKEIKPGQLLLMEPRGEVMQQLASGHRQVAVSIPVDLFRRVAAAEFIPEDRLDSFITWRTLILSERKLHLLHDMISGILGGNFPGSERPDADLLLTESISELLFDDETRDGKLLSRRNRRRITWEAVDLIRSRFHRPPTILELCEITGTSRRTLFYAFDDLLGLSPRAYINKVRLDAARRMIIRNRDKRCIQRIARELGFMHEGQFSIDYSSAFGETPSQTRRRFIRLRDRATEDRGTGVLGL